MQFCSTAIDNTRAKSHLNLKKYLKQIYPLRIHPFRIQREYLTKTRWSRGLTFLCNVKSRGEAAKACGVCQNATRDPSPVSSGLVILKDIGTVRSQVRMMEKRKVNIFPETAKLLFTYIPFIKSVSHCHSQIQGTLGRLTFSAPSTL